MQSKLTGREGEKRSKVVELRSQGTASSLTEGAVPQFNWRPPPSSSQRGSQNAVSEDPQYFNINCKARHLNGGKRCSFRRRLQSSQFSNSAVGDQSTIAVHPVKNVLCNEGIANLNLVWSFGRACNADCRLHCTRSMFCNEGSKVCIYRDF